MRSKLHIRNGLRNKKNYVMIYHFLIIYEKNKRKKKNYQKLNNYIISLLNLGKQSNGYNKFEYANIVQLNAIGLSGINSISLIKSHETY